MRNQRGVRLSVFGSLLLGMVVLTVNANSRPSDARLQVTAQDRLFHAKVGEKVSVRVEGGTATLEGTVTSLGNKLRAAKEVGKVDGISRVEDKTQVSAPGIEDAAILAEAAKQVRRYSYFTIFDNVELEARDGRLTVTGQVLQPMRKQDLGRILASVTGVKEMENRLEVLPLSPMDDEIRLRLARAIYRNSVLSRYAIQANPPIHIVVKNGNVTLTGVVNNALEKAVAEHSARFAALFFALDNQIVTEKTMNAKRS